MHAVALLLMDDAKTASVFDLYIAGGSPETQKALKKFVRFLQPFVQLLKKKSIMPWLGRDVKQAIAANGVIAAKVNCLKSKNGLNGTYAP